MSVSCECLRHAGTGICDWSIAHPEESCRIWCFVVCGLEKSLMIRSGALGILSHGGGGGDD